MDDVEKVQITAPGDATVAEPDSNGLVADGEEAPAAPEGGRAPDRRGVDSGRRSLQVVRRARRAQGCEPVPSSTGESMVVIGGSGSGKSVLIKHIMGLLRPDEGSVTVDGLTVADLKRSGARQAAAPNGNAVSVRGALRLDDGRRKRRLLRCASTPR